MPWSAANSFCGPSWNLNMVDRPSSFSLPKVFGIITIQTLYEVNNFRLLPMYVSKQADRTSILCAFAR